MNGGAIMKNFAIGRINNGVSLCDCRNGFFAGTNN